VAPDAEGWLIEELRPGHDRCAFSCGHASLNDFIRRYAGQNERNGVSRTFVAVHPGSAVVLGYYSLSAGSVEFATLTEEQRKHLPRYPVPTAHLGRLAVDATQQGKGLGSFLFIDALRRIAAADRHIAVHAVEVVAIDDAAKGFYLKYGFTELLDDPRHLYLSMKTVRALGLVE
jgi:ribosomal protein S18 acetylase RimI-like enzyme